MKILTTLLISLGLAGAALAASTKVPAISHDELKSAIANRSVTLLDVNGTDSFQEARIPGAIDFIAHEKKIASLLPEDKNALVVAYCGNEYCPAYLSAATTAMKLGYKNVKHYAPGIDGWRKSGAKVEKS
jgi:rhodanese-related sulfurtransferase